MIQFKLLNEFQSPTRLAVHDTEVKTQEAQMAVRFAELILSASDYARTLSAGLSAAHGESDRTLSLSTAKEITMRACDLASYMMIELRRREWIVETPGVDEIYKVKQDG